jgi:hypothetical protein
MKKVVFFVLLIGLSIPALQAQRKKTRFLDRCETVYGIGFSNFLGELGGRDAIGTNGIKDLEFILTRPSLHLGLRYRFNPTISLKYNLHYTVVSGRDSLTKEEFRRNRNLSFRSPIFESSFQAEFSILQLKSTKSRYVLRGVRSKSGIDLNWVPKVRVLLLRARLTKEFRHVSQLAWVSVYRFQIKTGPLVLNMACVLPLLIISMM